MATDCAPNKSRVEAAQRGLQLGQGRKIGLMTVFYAETGSGAEIVSERGWLIAEFPNHLDAQFVFDRLPKA